MILCPRTALSALLPLSVATLTACSGDLGLLLGERLQPVLSPPDEESNDVPEPPSPPPYEAPEPPSIPPVAQLPRDCGEQLISFDEQFEVVQFDLLTMDADDRPFARYLTLSNLFNAGVCTGDLEPERQALAKVLNALSMNSRLTEPVALDADELVYRIDMRDYNWDRPIELRGQVFTDGWEAILQSTPYAVRFQGDEAEQSALQTGTEVPLLYATALSAAATQGELYYALIDVDTSAPFGDFLLDDLAIDLSLNVALAETARAVTVDHPRITGADVLVTRDAIEVRAGVLWQTQVPSTNGFESIFSDPTALPPTDAIEALFTLPNGLMGFVLVQQNEQIVGELSHANGPTLDIVDLMAVHASALDLAVEDQMRPFVEANPFLFDTATVEQVQALYPQPEEFVDLVETDSALYGAALQRIGLPSSGPDPIAASVGRFEGVLDLSAVAGELGISATLLQSNIARTSLVLQSAFAESGVISREAFDEVFLGDLCVMQTFSPNRPLLDDCEAAIDARE